MTDLKNNLEEVWSSEFYDWYYENSQMFKGYPIPTRDFRLIYIEARKKAQDEINKLEQELQKTRDQLEIAEKASEIYLKDRRMLYKEMTRLNDLLCNGYIYYDDITEKVINEYIENGKRARQYFQDKDKQGE